MGDTKVVSRENPDDVDPPVPTPVVQDSSSLAPRASADGEQLHTPMVETNNESDFRDAKGPPEPDGTSDKEQTADFRDAKEPPEPDGINRERAPPEDIPPKGPKLHYTDPDLRYI